MNEEPRTRNSVLTRAQLRKIWATSHELGRDDAWVHALTYQVTGKESLRELSVPQAKRVIDALERLAGRKGDAPYHEQWGASVDEGGTLLITITPAQAAKLRAMAGRIGWDDRQVCTVVTRQLGRTVSSLRAIRAEEARRVMGLLEAIVLRREKERKQESLQFAGCSLQEED